MPARIDDQRRAQIITDLKKAASNAGKPSRNQIARTHGVSAGTITNIAREAGITSAFDQSKTVQAVRVMQFSAAAARARLIEDLYRDAQRFRDRAWSPYTQVVSGPAGSEFVTTKLPPLRDQQSAYSSIAICMDKAARAEDRDGDGKNAVIGSLLGSLFDSLHAAYGDDSLPGPG